MSYIARRTYFNNFSDYTVGEYFDLLIVLIAIFLWGIGSLGWGLANRDRTDEKNLYLALKGEPVEDKVAVETAKIVKLMRENQFQDWWRLPDAMTNRGRNSLIFVLRNWNEISDFLSNPNSEININPLPWKLWFLIAFLITWGAISLKISISYGIAYRSRNEDRAWQYPWDKVWAYPMVLFMWPHIIVTQPIVLVLFVKNEIIIGRGRQDIGEPRQNIGTPVREKSFEEILQEKKELFRKKVESVSHRLEDQRQKWIEINSKERLNSEKSKIEREIDDTCSYLLNIGKQIEEKQRDLAQARNKLKTTEEALSERKGSGEYGEEFDKLVSSPHIEAVEVLDKEIRVYTKTIIIKHLGIKYEIGNFLIVISYSGGIYLENLCNTHPGGHMHPHGGRGDICFGNMSDEIHNLIHLKQYSVLIGLVIQSLQSYNLLDRGMEPLAKWKMKIL